MSTPLDEIKGFVDEAERLNKQRMEEAMKNKGMNPYLQLPKGVTKFKLLPFKPGSRVSFGKDQYVFKVEQESKQYDWSVTKNSPLAIQIIRKLLEAPVDISVMRSGDGKTTRYEML